MSTELWVALIVVLSWASLPVSIIYANRVFDRDVVKPGEKAEIH